MGSDADMSLIAELEDALKQGSPEKRTAVLRRVTDVFLNDADRLNEQQIGVFDDVLCHLIQRIETKALVQLSASLAPVDNAPLEVVRNLARNDQIAVAGPVLSQSNRLTDDDLIEIAESKSQAHLLAMSGRNSLAEAVTDVLVERGDRQVSHRLAVNSGARFSETGFATLVRNAKTDDGLAERLGGRLDIPLQMLHQLLQQATDLVRSRLLASAPPEKQEEIQRALANVASAVAGETTKPRDFNASESLVQQLNRQGKLNEAVLANFARELRYEEMVSTLALFCQAPVEAIERLMKHVGHEGVVLACKAAQLSWPTCGNVLQARFAPHEVADSELKEARTSFLSLSQAAAQRALRFMLVQSTAKTLAS